jgi:NADPH-dependent curcumin reductase CurA
MAEVPGRQKCVVLARFPSGVPVPEDFAVEECDVPSPAGGEFLSRTHHLSLDPYIRGVISGRHMDSTPLSPGDVIVGRTVSEVVDSRHPDFEVGDFVLGANGWREYALSDGSGVRKLDADAAPLSTALGILGMPGLTAWAGLYHLGEPEPGDTVVVSAAAGPVGCMVGQLARLRGCRAVGIAGSAEKCRLVTEEFGFDACIDYKTQDVRSALGEVCPEKVDVYFDNVAGDTLTAVMGNLALGARIVLCGMITQYNSDGPAPPGPNLAPVIGARATVRGLVVYDHQDKEADFLRQSTEWLRQGKLAYREDVAEGLEQAPAAFCRLMRGENVGKAIVSVN